MYIATSDPDNILHFFELSVVIIYRHKQITSKQVEAIKEQFGQGCEGEQDSSLHRISKQLVLMVVLDSMWRQSTQTFGKCVSLASLQDNKKSLVDNLKETFMMK